jgi:uncharacterized protein (UPF0332 family)
MDVGKLRWCCDQNKGLKIIKPNDNLAMEYIQSAEETLAVLQDIKNKSNMWLATTKYYCEYFSVYALLMKLGIKCEIHECTIEVCRFLEERKIIPSGFTERLEYDKGLRIDNQSYLKNRKVVLDFTELRDFVLKIKNKVHSITFEETNKTREELRKVL